MERPPVEHNGDEIAFVGITDTGVYPPDPHLAVGTGHIVLVVNSAIAVYTKDGAFVWQMPLDGEGGFFDALGSTHFVFDPEVVYDTGADRFLLVVAERRNTQSWYLFAVSRSADPAASWHTWRIDVSNEIDGAIDSPNIAVGPDAYYLAADFVQPDRYLVTAIEKASVLDGGVPRTAHHVRVGTHSLGLATQHTPGATHMYMIETFDPEPSSAIRILAIEDPFGAFTLQSATLSVPPYLRPVDVPSRDTPAVVRAFDGRLWSSMYAAGSIWACHHATAGPAPVVNEVRWYEVATNGWPLAGERPSLVQAARVTSPEGAFLNFPAIAGDADGNAALIAARASPDEYFSIAYACRRASDASGTMRGPLVIKSSAHAFGRGRWGDYLGMVPDPVVPGRFWSHGMFVPLADGWATWVASHRVDVPALAAGSARGPIRATPQPARTTALLSLPPSDRARLIELFDVRGSRVRMLESTPRAAALAWDLNDETGRPVPAGVYLVRASDGRETVATGRLVVMR